MPFLTLHPKPPIIHVTVWVHGTHLHEFLPTGITDLTRKMEHTLFDCRQGFHKASNLDLQYYQYTLVKELAKSDPHRFPWEHCYIFGWSGKLDHDERKNAAYELYCALKARCIEYQELGFEPYITVITHSHGGNLVLNMAVIDDENYNLIVRRLILLACPIQQDTANLIKSTMFKRIYSIHSHTDLIQILDPQGLHPFMNVKKGDTFLTIWKRRKKGPLFSQRHFSIHPKVIQAAIRWNHGVPWPEQDDPLDGVYLKPIKKALKGIDCLKKNRGLLHIEFNLIPFIKKLSQIIQELDEHFVIHTHCINNTDPDVVIYL